MNGVAWVGGVFGGARRRAGLVSLLVLALAGCGGEGSTSEARPSATGGSAGALVEPSTGGDTGEGNGDGGTSSGDGGKGSSDGGSTSSDGGSSSGDGGGTGNDPVLHADTSAPVQVVAGETISVTCLLLDENGDAEMPGADVTSSISFEPGDAVQIDEEGVATAARAGQVQASCSFPELKLTDESPATFEIVAGAPTNVTTTVDDAELTAGDTVTATCEVADAFGNVIEGVSPTLSVTPEDGGNSIAELTATLTKAGSYTVACTVPGATSPGASVTVAAALPASIVISRSPEAASYPLGSVVLALTTVSDKFGNVVADAPLTYESVPAVDNVGGPEAFQYLIGGDGFAITATVTGPTEGDVSLSATTTFDIEGNGPSITCASPADGAMVNAAPGSPVTLQGGAQDVNGITSVKINGEAVSLVNGQFAHSVTSRFGINFNEVVVTNKFGKQAKKTCTFLSSNQWAGETPLYNDTLSWKLTQGAVDDVNRNNGLNSLADILYAVANSQSVMSTVHSAFNAANPLKASSCDSESCTFLGCICFYRSGVTYQGLPMDGPHTVQLTLVNGGYAAKVHFVGVHVNLRVWGDTLGITYDTTGYANFAYVDVNLTFDQVLSGGKPRIMVRPNSVTTALAAPTLSGFSGLDGWYLNNIVTPMANGVVANTLKTQLQSYVTNNFNSVLDSVVSGLDVTSLGSSYNVPKLDASGSIPVSFGLGFSTLNTTASRALYGIGTKLTAPAGNARSSLGVAIPPGTVLNDPGVAGSATTAISEHVGIFNQVAHALWRANMFDTTLSGTILGGTAPAEAQVTTMSLLPPVANLAPYGSNTPNAVELSLGALAVQIVYPGLFTAESPLQGSLGARITLTPTLVGNDLKFGSPTIADLYFDTTTPLSDADRATVEALLELVIQKIANGALNDGLPALPLPTFALPASLAQFGITSGRLGTVNPVLSYTPRHYVLTGGFGRP